MNCTTNPSIPTSRECVHWAELRKTYFENYDLKYALNERDREFASLKAQLASHQVAAQSSLQPAPQTDPQPKLSNAGIRYCFKRTTLEHNNLKKRVEALEEALKDKADKPNKPVKKKLMIDGDTDEEDN